jgi:feruloyl esterase
VSWLIAHGLLADLAFNDPALDILGDRVIDARGAILPSAVRVVDHQLRSGLVDPSQMAALFATDHKLIIFQGLSDPVNDPYSAVATYREMTRSAGGADVARDSARLFMVPGMQHCHGGPGPNAFDPLAAMESWVEQGVAPDALIAAKFPDEDRSKPPVRTMPLCPFPAMARYDGKGDVTTASSWRCTASDRGLEQVGPAGMLAGFDHALARD